MSTLFQAPANRVPDDITLNLGEEVYYAFHKKGSAPCSPHYSIHNEDMTELRGNVSLSEVREYQRLIANGEARKVSMRINSPFAS